jgi:hypothetical protein
VPYEHDRTALHRENFEMRAAFRSRGKKRGGVTAGCGPKMSPVLRTGDDLAVNPRPAGVQTIPEPTIHADTFAANRSKSAPTL